MTRESAAAFRSARPAVLATAAAACLAAACGRSDGGDVPAVAARLDAANPLAVPLGNPLGNPLSRPAAKPRAGGDDGIALTPLDLDHLRAAPDPQPVARPLKLFEVRDADGRICSRVPLPDDWRMNDLGGGRYELAAPGGVKANATESASYAWSDDPFMRETMARAGSQLAPVLEIERIVREGIEPEAERQGYRLQGTRELPQLQAFWQAFLAAMPATGNRRSARVLATDWRGPDDARSCIVVLQTIVASGASVSWSVQTTELEAPAARFDAACRTWLDGLTHTQVDRGWQRAKGMELTASMRHVQDQSRRWMQLSARQHQQRMADIAAAGRTALQAGRTSSDILDQGHASYRRRSAVRDAGHAHSVDGVLERTVVTHPESGQRYHVQAGHRFYWSDGNGGYFGTDDANFDPRLDPALRHLPWVRMQQGR